MAIMVVRGAVVAILVGLLPMSAAASNTATGKQWFSRVTAWLLAFLLVKPAAAMLYAAGMQLESSTDSAQAELSGVFVLLLAVFALPALLRFARPGHRGGWQRQRREHDRLRCRRPGHRSHRARDRGGDRRRGSPDVSPPHPPPAAARARPPARPATRPAGGAGGPSTAPAAGAVRGHSRPRPRLGQRLLGRRSRTTRRPEGADMAVTPARPTYGHWVRPRSPGIGPLGLLPSAGLLAGLVITLLAFPDPRVRPRRGHRGAHRARCRRDRPTGRGPLGRRDGRRARRLVAVPLGQPALPVRADQHPQPHPPAARRPRREHRAARAGRSRPGPRRRRPTCVRPVHAGVPVPRRRGDARRPLRRRHLGRAVGHLPRFPRPRTRARRGGRRRRHRTGPGHSAGRRGRVQRRPGRSRAGEGGHGRGRRHLPRRVLGEHGLPHGHLLRRRHLPALPEGRRHRHRGRPPRPRTVYGACRIRRRDRRADDRRRARRGRPGRLRPRRRRPPDSRRLGGLRTGRRPGVVGVLPPRLRDLGDLVDDSPAVRSGALRRPRAAAGPRTPTSSASGSRCSTARTPRPPPPRSPSATSRPPRSPRPAAAGGSPPRPPSGCARPSGPPPRSPREQGSPGLRCSSP